MKFLERFKKKENLLGIDIGSAYIKVAQLDIGNDRPLLEKWAYVPTPQGAYRNNVLEKADQVGQKISDLLIKHDFERRRVAVALPAPVVFTKKIKIPKLAPRDIRAHVQMEAVNFIPHNIDAVRLDYHVLSATKNHMEVMVVAAKNDIIKNYQAAIEAAGLELAIIDIDYFVLQNIFELVSKKTKEYPNEPVAILNIGARYSTLTIVEGNEPLFTSDVGVGTDLVKDALMTLPEFSDSDYLVLFNSNPDNWAPKIQLLFEQKLDQIVTECSRQISLVWGNASHDHDLRTLLISGGGSALPGIVEKFKARAKMKVELLDVPKIFDKNTSPILFSQPGFELSSLSLGLGVRYPGDRFMEDW